MLFPLCIINENVMSIYPTGWNVAFCLYFKWKMPLTFKRKKYRGGFRISS
jgi:hypothetical protein